MVKFVLVTTAVGYGTPSVVAALWQGVASYHVALEVEFLGKVRCHLSLRLCWGRSRSAPQYSPVS